MRKVPDPDRPARLPVMFHEDRFRVTYVGSLARPPELRRSGAPRSTAKTTTTWHPRRGLRQSVTDVVREAATERIVRPAKRVGRERVIARTDGGSAQTRYLTCVHPGLIWAELAALVERARLPTQQTW
jgi:hypothetical protein